MINIHLTIGSIPSHQEGIIALIAIFVSKAILLDIVQVLNVIDVMVEDILPGTANPSIH